MNNQAKLDFIGIGAQKAGSTWLFKMLNQHPDINFGGGKQIDFFNDKHPFYYKDKSRNYDKGIEWYREILNLRSDQLNGDITPEYLWDDNCAARIHEHFPNVKIIAILRDPVDRALSEYIYSNRTFHIPENFGDAIRKHQDYIEKGLYGRQLEKYFSLFPKENIKIFLYDDLCEDSAALLGNAERFLGLAEFLPDDVFEETNNAKYPRCTLVNRLLTKLQKIKTSRIGGRLWSNSAFLKARDFTIQCIKKHNLREGTKPEIDADTLNYLRDYYTEDIELLRRFISRDLSNWLAVK